MGFRGYATSAVVATALTAFAALGTAAAPASALLLQPAKPSTSYVWIGSSQDSHGDNHSWTDARNWSPQGVPGSGDSVSVAPPDQSHCVAHVDAIPTGVALADFALTVGTGCGASVSGGSITVEGTFSWDSGVIDTPMTIGAGATGTISGFVNGNPRKQLTQNFAVDGSLALVGANLEIFDPTTLTVDPGGTFSASGSPLISGSACCVTPARLVNDGTIEVSDGTFTVQGVELDQHAVVNAAGGAVLRETAAPMTATSGASYTGTGRLQIWNGTAATMTGTQTLGTGFHLEMGNDGAGGDTLGGTVTIAGRGTFDWTGGTIMANLTLAHTVTMHVYGVNTGNGLRILNGLDSSGGGSVPSTLVDRGSIVVDQQAGFATSQTAHLQVASNGSLSLAPGTAVTAFGCCVNPSTIDNVGGRVLVPKDSSGAGPATLTGVAYRATSGTTQLAKGAELQLLGGPQSSLSSTTVSGGGRLTISDPTTLSGTLTLAGTSSLRLAQSPGTLDGTATVAGTGTFDWRGGSVSGALTLAPGHVDISGPNRKLVANINGGSQPSTVLVTSDVTIGPGTAKAHNLLDMGSSTLTLAGGTTVAKSVELNGGTLVNTGSLTFDPGAKGSDSTDVNLLLANQGSLQLASGTLTASGSTVQSAGTTTIGGSSVLSAPFSSHPVTINGGTLTGTGTVNGVLLNNSGVVDPGSVQGAQGTGTLAVTGAYTQGSGGRLSLDIDAAGQDLLAVGGKATMAGTLLSRTLTGYHPPLSTTRTVLTATGGLAWSVTCVITGGQDSGSGHWSAVPHATSLDVVWQSGSATTC